MDTFYTCYESANTAFIKKDYLSAEKSYLEALEIDSTALMVYEKLIECYILQTKFQQAVDLFTKMHEFVSHVSFENYRILADFFINSYEYLLAEKILNIALNFFPDEISIYNLLLKLYAAIKDEDKWKKVYVAACEKKLGRKISLSTEEFLEIPKKSNVAIFGNLHVASLFSFILERNKPEIKQYLLDVSMEDLNRSSAPLISFANYMRYCKEVDHIIVCGVNFQHSLDMLKSIIDHNIIPEHVEFIVPPSLNEIAGRLKMPENLVISLCDSINDAGKDITALLPEENLNFTILQQVLNKKASLGLCLLKYAQNIIHSKKAKFAIVTLDELHNIEQKSYYENKLRQVDFSSQGYTPDHLDALWGEISDDPADYYYRIVNNKIAATVNEDDLGDHSTLRTIHFIGNSKCKGVGSEPNHSIHKLLQRHLNKTNKKYITRYSGGCTSLSRFVERLDSVDIKSGDVVMLVGFGLNEREKIDQRFRWSILDSADIRNSSSCHIHCGFNDREANKEVFVDMFHLNYRGNSIIAKSLYDFLFSDGCEECISDYKIRHNEISAAEHNDIIQLMSYYRMKDYNFSESEINSYIDHKCSSIIDNDKDANNGCIVMNCNPFTNGHKYLIEYSAQKVDKLIIFVVEENRSYFKFDDRIMLVKKGVAHLDNVVVVPSGDFIISAKTFPEYFNKDDLQTTNINATGDLNIFGKIIAPKLNINRRFIGQEPNDMVTRQYNEQMKVILPNFNIIVEEIARKEFETEKAISASLVRKYIDSKQTELIKQLVPETTYEFLYEKFFHSLKYK